LCHRIAQPLQKLAHRQ
ncbi:hypothetical protein D029_2414B, partial [Vibrio parahaemolyticus 970107]